VETSVLTIPPPVTDLELRLDCSVPTYPPGDSNCSTDVNSIDAAVDLQYAAGLLGSIPCDDVADVDGDGDVDAIDAALVLQYGAGLLDHLPV
jgi:hypothetical protein